MFRVIFTVLILAGLIFVVSLSKVEKLPTQVACIIGEYSVSKQDLKNNLKLIMMEQGVKKVTPEEEKKINKEYIQGQVLLRSPAAKKVSSQDVDEGINELIQTYFSNDKELYKETIKEQNTSEDRIRENIKIALIKQELTADIPGVVSGEIPEKALEAHYKAYPDHFIGVRNRKIKTLTLGSEEEAKEALKHLNKNNWKDAASAISLDSLSNEKGGERTVLESDGPPAYIEKVFSAKTGVISKPFISELGWHIILPLEETKDGKLLSYKEAKDIIAYDYLHTMEKKKTEEEVKKVKDVRCHAEYDLG